MLSKSQARLFFLGGTIVSFVIFLGLSWKTLSDDVPRQTNAQNITPDVVRGKKLWESNNCMGCHTIFGEGAYYAPELTKVMDRRGEAYVKLLLTSKEPWAPRGRKMVAYGFSDQEAADIMAFFTWCGKADLNGFPAKPKYQNLSSNK